jgi:outer membrane protein TolC
MGLGLTQPIFHGGELTAKRREAIAAYDQSLALYRVTVLQAFQNVADVLRALESDAEAFQVQAQAEQTARDSLDLARRDFELGGASYLTLLNAQRQQQQALITLTQARAARLTDTAALFQALGGGWWNRQGTPDQAAKPAEKALTRAK